jgi:antitoxin component HigA of HigAB toxin-antitoxin module
MSAMTFAEIIAQAEETHEYWKEVAVLDFTSEMQRIMDQKGISNADLAKKIGTSRAYITKVFNGNANFTMDTMVKLVHSLNARLHIHISEKEEDVHWLGVYSKKKRKAWKPKHEIDADNKMSPYFSTYPTEMLPKTTELIDLEDADSKGWWPVQKALTCNDL